MTASDPTAEFQRLIVDAEAASAKGDWSEAAELWITAAGVAESSDAEPLVAKLACTAGEAFRRADRPADALNALQMGMARGAVEASTRVTLSAVLASMARPEAALEQARLAGEADLAIDAQAAVLQSTAPRAAFDACWRRLRDPIARGFRQAQSLRMEGRLDDARQVLGVLESQLAEHPVGRGGVYLERAELDALQGDLDGAVEAFTAGVRDQERAGRMALVWSITACHLRCLLDAGITPAHPVDDGIQWASSRGLRLLGLDLSLVDARMRGDVRGLTRVRDDAAAAGLVRRSGRASAALAGATTGPTRLLHLQRAIVDLAEDLPLWLRARVSHAEALAAMSPSAGARAAEQLVTAVHTAGMEPEKARLAALEA